MRAWQVRFQVIDSAGAFSFGEAQHLRWAEETLAELKKLARKRRKDLGARQEKRNAGK